MKIYYHEIGKSQTADQLIFEDKTHPLRYFNASVTEDEKFLLVNVSEGTSGNEVLVQDLSKKEKGFKTLFSGFKNNFNVIDNQGEKILALTDQDAPRYRLVEVDPINPAPKNWKDIISQSPDLLENVGTAGGKLFPVFLKDASSRVFQYGYNGKMDNR